MSSWVIELIDDWAQSDWRDTERRLGMPSVSPMFRNMVESNAEAEPSGYSEAEVRLVAIAIENIRENKPEHYRALTRKFKPWLKKKLPAGDNDDQLLREVVQMIADFVDQSLG